MRNAPPILAAALAAGLTLAPRASAAQGRSRPGDLAVEVAFGRAMTFARNPIGRTVSDVEDPLMTRLAASVHLGAGIWIDGSLRATPDADFSRVRWFSGGGGLRLDTSDSAVVSTAVRLGWSAVFTRGINHGAYATFAINVRPARVLTLFAEAGAEAYPGMTFERTTANGRVREQSIVMGVLWYGGGVRFAL